jgi:hypothetical protein
LLSFHENRPWDNNMGLFGLKISRDVDRASLMVALLMVSLPDFYKAGATAIMQSAVLFVILVFFNLFHL